MNNSNIRLNKAIADAGFCSRRKADEYIGAGKVFVNGNLINEPGIKVNPMRDRIEVAGTPLAQKATETARHTYLLLHKPIQVVSTASDPQGRETVLDLVPPTWRKKRLYPVGRLDYFSEGLVLLTDDGPLTHRLTHPRYHLPKVYTIRVREEILPAMLEQMRTGMILTEGERLAPVEARVLPGRLPVLELVLHQGINRQIRRMCRDLGLTILSLRRVCIGPLHLGDLPKGQCRELAEGEIKALRKAAELE